MGCAFGATIRRASFQRSGFTRPEIARTRRRPLDLGKVGVWIVSLIVVRREPRQRCWCDPEIDRTHAQSERAFEPRLDRLPADEVVGLRFHEACILGKDPGERFRVVTYQLFPVLAPKAGDQGRCVFGLNESCYQDQAEQPVHEVILQGERTSWR